MMKAGKHTAAPRARRGADQGCRMAAKQFNACGKSHGAPDCIEPSQETSSLASLHAQPHVLGLGA